MIFASLMAALASAICKPVKSQARLRSIPTALTSCRPVNSSAGSISSRPSIRKVTDVKVVGMADYNGGLRPRMNTGDYGDVVLILPPIPSTQYKQFYEPLDDLGYQDKIHFPDEWKDKASNISYGISSATR